MTAAVSAAGFVTAVLLFLAGGPIPIPLLPFSLFAIGLTFLAFLALFGDDEPWSPA